MQICMDLNDHMQTALETVRERAAEEWGEGPNKIIDGHFARTAPDELIVKMCVLKVAEQCRAAMAKDAREAK